MPISDTLRQLQGRKTSRVPFCVSLLHPFVCYYKVKSSKEGV